MTIQTLARTILAATICLALTTVPAAAQQRRSGPMRDAVQADLAGNTKVARTIIQQIIDTATAPADRAAAQRAMAMSYAFDGDCANTMRYERMVIDYWKTREIAEPQNAFYQQGEMADEGARVCIDSGDLDAAESAYRLGYQLGNMEPAPRTHPRSLWDFRLAHALGRIAARRGNAAEAMDQIAKARRALDRDSTMAAQQERFFPYLVGYVAFHTGDLATAESEIKKAVEASGGRDPFQHALLGMIYEKQGRADAAQVEYRNAYDGATSHNPPAAFARPFARKKLGIKEP